MSFLMIVWLAIFLGATGTESLAPKALTADGKRIVDAPNFAAFGEAQCDSNGDLFFHLANGSFDNPEILELSHDGKSGASFRLRPETAQKVSFDSSFISPDGKVYVIAQSSSNERLVFPFAEDGTQEEPIRIQTPSHLIVEQFVVFNDGAIFISGRYNDGADSKLQSQSFATIFSPSGEIRRSLSGDLRSEPNQNTSKSHLPKGGAVLGDDGNAYFFGSNEVVVLSSSGNIQRHLEFDKPDPDWTATRLNYSKGLLAVIFSKADEKHRIQRRYLVLSSTSGDTVGWYAPSEDTGSHDVCFQDGSEFVFMGSTEGNQLYLVTSHIR